MHSVVSVPRPRPRPNDGRRRALQPGAITEQHSAERQPRPSIRVSPEAKVMDRTGGLKEEPRILAFSISLYEVGVQWLWACPEYGRSISKCQRGDASEETSDTRRRWLYEMGEWMRGWMGGRGRGRLCLQLHLVLQDGGETVISQEMTSSATVSYLISLRNGR